MAILPVMMSLSACSADSRSGIAEEVDIVSLRQWLPALEAKAREWRADAYLARASIPVGIGDYSPWLISADFDSPAEEYEGLIVTLENDETISAKVVEGSVHIAKTAPITPLDWRLDSSEALKLALDAEGLRFLERNPVTCSFLELWRLPGSLEGPVTWRLMLSECEGQYFREITLDAATGTILQFREGLDLLAELCRPLIRMAWMSRSRSAAEPGLSARCRGAADRQHRGAGPRHGVRGS